LLIFAAAALAILPLAGFLGHVTEALAVRTGESIGGLLNATFGNAAESRQRDSTRSATDWGTSWSR